MDRLLAGPTAREKGYDGNVPWCPASVPVSQLLGTLQVQLKCWLGSCLLCLKAVSCEMRPVSVSARVPGALRLVDLCSENIHFILGPRNRGLWVSETNKLTDRQSLFLVWEIASLVKAQEKGLEFSPQNEVGQRLLSVLRTLVNETTEKAVSHPTATEGRPPTAHSLSKARARVQTLCPSMGKWELGAAVGTCNLHAREAESGGFPGSCWPA